jgi:hypothetical protein
MIDPKKPFKITATELKRRADILPGSIIPFEEDKMPIQDKERKIYKLSCEICAFNFHHRLYVCPRCGTCQACGGLNEIGDINQACRHCGNGAQIPDIIPPTIESEDSDHEHRHEWGQVKKADPSLKFNGDKNDIDNLHQQNSIM